MTEEKGKSKIIKEVRGWVVSIIIAFFVAMLIRTYIFEPVETPTGSMLDTIKLHERVIVNKFIYWFEPIQRGDIVVFKYPDNPSENYLKRVIGIGGDTIRIEKGTLYVNDIPQEEDYIKEPMDPYRDFGPVTVPEGHYFMLGDNRNYSKDSRLWINKYVSRDAIIGKIVFRIFPFNRVGIVK